VGANGGVLRLVVSEKSNAAAPVASEEIAHANFPGVHFHHRRGGRHGHHGPHGHHGRGWGHGYGHGPGFDHGSHGHAMYGGHPGCASENPWREKWAKKQEKFLKKQEKFAQNPESLQQRIACISRKIQHLQSRLTELETAGPENVEKAHKMIFYRQKLQEKINFLSSRLEHLREVASRVPPAAGSAPATNVTSPVEVPPVPIAESQPVAEPLPSRDEVLRELDELESVATALRFALREANLQLQLRRNDLQSAQYQLQNGADTSITKERIAELKALVVQAKELEQAKKIELKAHMQRTCAAKRQLKAIKMAEKGRKCDKAERKAAKDLMRQQKLANKAAKKEEIALGIPPSAPKNF
jgi:hypothetical protein